MGLDMNIYKNKTVKTERGERFKRTVEITEVLYLRKANQIHKYIVENFADGVDECQEIGMEIDDIKDLKERCEQVVKGSKLVDGWNYYNDSSSRWLSEADEVELAEKKNNRFESTGKCSVMVLSVGDYIYDNDHCAEKVEKIEKRDDKYLVRCGVECREKVIKNPELAENLLPTQAGFFFGDTTYNENYIDDLKEYIRQADEIIADYDNEIANGTDKYDLDYTYEASW